jgi:hypothetical protein
MEITMKFDEVIGDGIKSASSEKINADMIVVIRGNLPNLVYVADKIQHPIKPMNFDGVIMDESQWDQIESKGVEYMKQLYDDALTQYWKNVSIRKERREEEEKRKQLEASRKLDSFLKTVPGSIPSPEPGKDVIAVVVRDSEPKQPIPEKPASEQEIIDAELDLANVLNENPKKKSKKSDKKE